MPNLLVPHVTKEFLSRVRSKAKDMNLTVKEYCVKTLVSELPMEELLTKIPERVDGKVKRHRMASNVKLEINEELGTVLQTAAELETTIIKVKKARRDKKDKDAEVSLSDDQVLAPIEVDQPSAVRKPLCKDKDHSGFWRPDGYWCAGCGKLFA